MSVQRRGFPESFKREAVDRVANRGLTAGAVARELGLHDTVLRRWTAQFGMQATGQNGLGTSRRENGQLRMERDILKKAALIFGATSQRPPPPQPAPEDRPIAPCPSSPPAKEQQ